MATVHTFPLGPLETNCYVVVNGGEAVAVDPGGDPGELVAFLNKEKATLTHILITHLHFDHIYGGKALADATGAKVHANPGDAFLMETEVGKGGFMGLPLVPEFQYAELRPGTAEFAGLCCEILPTPGHTPGSLSFHFPDLGCVFVGDLVFYRSVGRSDFPGGSHETLLHSVREHIFPLPEGTVLYPGHGPETTVGDEKNHNPYFAGF